MPLKRYPRMLLAGIHAFERPWIPTRESRERRSIRTPICAAVYHGTPTALSMALKDLKKPSGCQEAHRELLQVQQMFIV